MGARFLQEENFPSEKENRGRLFRDVRRQCTCASFGSRKAGESSGKVQQEMAECDGVGFLGQQGILRLRGLRAVGAAGAGDTAVSHVLGVGSWPPTATPLSPASHPPVTATSHRPSFNAL